MIFKTHPQEYRKLLPLGFFGNVRDLKEGLILVQTLRRTNLVDISLRPGIRFSYVLIHEWY